MPHGHQPNGHSRYLGLAPVLRCRAVLRPRCCCPTPGLVLTRHTLFQPSTARAETGNAVGWTLLRLAPSEDSRQLGEPAHVGVDQASACSGCTIPLLRSFLAQNG